MNRRWICSDVWMDIFPFFDRPELGLKMALLSDRFDCLVDTHFDGKELTIWRTIAISRNIEKPKAQLCTGWMAMDFPLPDRPLPNKIRFKDLRIEYIDHSVIAFLRSNKRSFDTIGTKLELFIEHCDQSIWDVFIHEIWPIISTNIRHLSFADRDHLDNFRGRISPTILTDLDQLNSIDSDDLFPDVIADDGPNATADQVLSKWLHTPRKDGQPELLHCRDYYGRPTNLGWVNNLKEAFPRATSSVSYIIRIDNVIIMPTEPFELVNERTKEKLTLETVSRYDEVDLLLKRCPIIVGETAAEFQWKNVENCDDNLNYVQFELWRGIRSIGPLSPQSTEEKAEQSIENVV